MRANGYCVGSLEERLSFRSICLGLGMEILAERCQILKIFRGPLRSLNDTCF